MKTVLTAEDNPTNRELLRELLEIRGYAGGGSVQW